MKANLKTHKFFFFFCDQKTEVEVEVEVEMSSEILWHVLMKNEVYLLCNTGWCDTGTVNEI